MATTGHSGPVAPAAGAAAGAPPTAWRPLLAVAGAVAAVLVVTSGRYGYHRDELYFLVAGRHLDWGFPDQPPLTPLLARLADVSGSLVALRLPSALAAAATVLVAGLIAAELGGGRRAQLIAAACTAVSAVTLVTGHIVSTTTYDVLFSALLCWLLARLVRTRRDWLLVPAGTVLGLGLLNKTLIGFLAAALVAGLLLSGPREVLRSPWLVGGLACAVVLGAPYVVWQALNGWPQLEMSRAIAAEGDQGGRLGFLPFQLLLVSPVLVPVWVAGLVRLLRAPAARPFRFLAVGFLLLAGLYLVTGGKAYYLAGVYPALLAAGAVATDGWLAAGAGRLRSRLLVGAIALSAVVGAVIGLAVLPARALGPVLAVNPDAGEQVAWPRHVETVAGVWAGLSRSEQATGVVVTANYGEAGAIERYGAAAGLPLAYSGHNGFARWRQPRGSVGPVVVVGYGRDQVDRFFGSCQRRATLDNGLGLDTEEQGAPVWLCGFPVRPWAEIWPEITHLG
ncbi:MAG TPA: glycosyltransferase family 39 protein [Mycobacteriales bacterium]|nr:glycosyltransferase family 39 protein [Mycobacteriales bacterium]